MRAFGPSTLRHVTLRLSHAASMRIAIRRCSTPNIPSTPTIIWNDTTPFSKHYDDTYFHKHHALDESSHVFLDANHVPLRVRELRTDDTLTVVELGFGTGRNFCNTWLAYEKNASNQPDRMGTLYYHAIEKHPLDPASMERALSYPQFDPIRHHISTFLDVYKRRYNGEAGHPSWTHTFSHGRIAFTLIIGDVVDILPKMQQKLPGHYRHHDCQSPFLHPFGAV
eukprot:TRINITY_DN497_c1_g2_i1.p1 TRINITY_DN497_c1_g2~~TRINITY_DN497_c1_g2_i1.p1  ORF type:complete len:224 (+),score=18.97 TRINITY_DN497_c1_g2_i1:92-763(+)